MATAEQKKKAPEMSHEMPAHFRRATSASDAPWHQPTPGHSFSGRLLGRFEMPPEPGRKPRAYYQVRLATPADVAAKVEGSNDYVPQIAKAGEVISVDERKALECLRDLAESEKDYDVWISVLGKKKLDGGHTFWQIDVGFALAEEG
jgi:hypothetical protein